MYRFPLTYNQNSVNTSGLYNILYEGNLIYKDVTFPIDIEFKEYKPYYQIEIVKQNCGSKKVYNLTNVGTTTFNITDVPKTTVPYVPPTTTQYVSTTEAPITTTVLPTTLSLSYIISSCYATNGIKYVVVDYNISGYYNGSYKLEIRTVDNTLQYTLDKTSGTVILRRGAYSFALRDTNSNVVIQSITTPILNCPMPSFVASYVPNTVGKKDAKVEVNNILNTSRLRWCYGATFTCDNLFTTPDVTVQSGETSVTINTNTGVDEDYTTGDFITIRGFGLVEDEYYDYTVAVTPATPLIDDKTIKVVTIAYDLGDNLEVNSYLVKNGKKVVVPTDVTSYYSYALYDSTNSPTVNQSSFITIAKGDSSATNIVSKNGDNSMVFFCVNEIFPTEFETIKFINNNPC